MKEKAQKDVLELDGTVLESLPNANFRVQLQDSEQVRRQHDAPAECVDVVFGARLSRPRSIVPFRVPAFGLRADEESCLCGR